MFKSKYVLLILALILVVATSLIPGQINAAAPAGYSLVWSDEGDGAAGSAVNGSKWNMVNQGGGFGNAELQYYTNRTANSFYDGAGNLVLKAIKESYNGSNYTSAKLTSQNKGDWTYCYVEIRAKLTRGRCVWPAFWMMPTASKYGGWPVCGEIDIMENRGDQTNKVGGTIHFGNPWKYIGASYTLSSGTFDAGYHVFGMEWDAGVLRWYVDGNLYETRTHTEWYCSAVTEATNPYAPFDQNFYLQLNVAVGGPGTPYTGNQNPDDSAFPQSMYIDYVRVYKKGAGPTPTTPASTPTPPPAGRYNIPGKIEAENWAAMSGVQTEATSDTGGGLNVGWIETNDWMDYNVNVTAAGTYKVDYRVSSTNTTGKVDLRNGSTTLASTTVPNTGGWQAWTTVSANVNLSAGNQTLRVFASGGGFNINWVNFSTSGTSTPTPPPSGATLLSQGKPASASSFQAGNEVAKGNDGNTGTRWAASGATYPQWWSVDLGSNKNISRVDISWYNSGSRAYKYRIETSTDNVTFTTRVDKTGNATNGDTSDSFSVSARYVRITITGCTAAGAYASATEFKVYGN